MRRGWIVMLLLLSLGVNLGLVTSLLLARPRAGEQQPKGTAWVSRVEGVADELDLGLEVKQRFVERHRQFIAAAREPRERLRQHQAELVRELFAQPSNPARIDELVAASGVEMARFEKEMARLVLDIRAILPAEKQTTYLRFVSRMQSVGWAAGRAQGERPRSQ